MSPGGSPSSQWFKEPRLTAHVPYPLKTRLFCLLAGLSAVALAACTASPTPAALDTATPPAAAPSATTAPTATKPTATATDAAAATATATATEPEASDTPTKAASATPTETEAATATLPPTTALTIFNTKSQWDVSSTVDTSGCATQVAPIYGLTLMTPTEGGFQWYNTAQDTLTFTQVGDGVYTYSGPYTAGTGTATLQVTITSDTTLRL